MGLMTVEGEKDDICSIGQTLAAQDLCTGVRAYRKVHHMQAGVGHYGVFSRPTLEQRDLSAAAGFRAREFVNDASAVRSIVETLRLTARENTDPGPAPARATRPIADCSYRVWVRIGVSFRPLLS